VASRPGGQVDRLPPRTTARSLPGTEPPDDETNPYTATIHGVGLGAQLHLDIQDAGAWIAGWSGDRERPFSLGVRRRQSVVL
jgi:hypothetical protein